MRGEMGVEKSESFYFIDISTSGLNLFMVADATGENDGEERDGSKGREEANTSHEVVLDLVNQLLEAAGIIAVAIVGADHPDFKFILTRW